MLKLVDMAIGLELRETGDFAVDVVMARPHCLVVFDFWMDVVDFVMVPYPSTSAGATLVMPSPPIVGAVRRQERHVARGAQRDVLMAD